MSDEPDLANLYRQTMDRITELVNAPDVSSGHRGCRLPGWSVRDVLAHMAAVAQDWAAGRRAAPPNEEQTAAQVARFDGRGLNDILTAWAGRRPEIPRLAPGGIAPPLGDVVVHEHDIADALGGQARGIRLRSQRVSDQLLRMLVRAVPVRVIVEDGEYHCGLAGTP